MQLNKMQVNEIEVFIEKVQKEAVVAKTNFYEALSYLARTKRYKENPQYRQASFKEYLRGRFNIPPSRYYREREMYLRYADKVELFDAGVVNRIIQNFKVADRLLVFQKIEAAKRKHKKVFQPHFAHDIIDNLIKQKAPTPKALLEQELAVKKAEIERLQKIIKEKNQRIWHLNEIIKELRNSKAKVT